jgi:hypothetical protein
MCFSFTTASVGAYGTDDADDGSTFDQPADRAVTSGDER